MIMEIKMNNSLTFDEVADKLGCSVEDLQKIAFKKILFSFGSMESLRNFAVLTVRQTLLLRRAAVNCSMVIGHFLCLILNDIRRLSIRSHCFVLRGKVCWTVSSVYGNRFSVVYNDLNAYSHE